MDNATWTLLAWIVTVLLIPLIIAFWKSESKRRTEALAAKEKADTERHTALASLVTERHNTVMTELNKYCEQNGEDHNELFTERRQHEVRIKAIETVHQIKGCNLPLRAG
jgi:flagellar biosynthesis/type III secretory pathway M-ring protein FliF/YscJ